MLRVFAVLVIIATAVVLGSLWVVPLAFAAGEAAAAPSTLDQIKEGLLGLVLLVITIVAAFVAKALPGLLEAARLWLIERATSERVQRIDAAIDTALDAGDDPETAASVVRAKLPQTLKRSGKSVLDIEDEAETRRRARRNATQTTAK